VVEDLLEVGHQEVVVLVVVRLGGTVLVVEEDIVPEVEEDIDLEEVEDTGLEEVEDIVLEEVEDIDPGEVVGIGLEEVVVGIGLVEVHRTQVVVVQVVLVYQVVDRKDILVVVEVVPGL
jgi:hypothetical protein